ncbi:unnamed protein product [Schistocephalus solidus]|uniref:Uncharacterized protein n=1 Tax=Schistocephalus solidus TaxID=70667 RepID=A0A183TCL7_SCHSO|nr:unnamed protein product [Schistocephalus solidus]
MSTLSTHIPRANRPRRTPSDEVQHKPDIHLRPKPLTCFNPASYTMVTTSTTDEPTPGVQPPPTTGSILPAATLASISATKTADNTTSPTPTTD